MGKVFSFQVMVAGGRAQPNWQHKLEPQMYIYIYTHIYNVHIIIYCLAWAYMILIAYLQNQECGVEAGNGSEHTRSS